MCICLFGFLGTNSGYVRKMMESTALGVRMRKPYLLHESEYRRMKQEGIESWMERDDDRSIGEDDERFLIDAMAQPWFPKKGRVMEIGCGTAPILRWFAVRNYSGFGIDVSKTAIAMAKEQSKHLNLRFEQADICRLNADKYPKFHICIDGLCFHCLTSPDDRKAMLANCKRLLKPNGVFILLTMCSPLDKVNYSHRYPRQKMLRNLIYVPHSTSKNYEGTIVMEGANFMPIRYVGHWRKILADLKRAGFRIRLFRFKQYTPEDVCSSLAVCAQ